MTDVGGPWCDGRTMSEDLQLPPFLRPFVLPYQPVEPLHVGDLDLYLPQATPAPAVLMIHGGPIRPDMPARPRQWSAYRGYASLLAQTGLVGAMFEHGFVDDQTLVWPATTSDGLSPPCVTTPGSTPIGSASGSSPRVAC
jgi:hypothetical protein